jgi:hypothetical protein
MPYGCTVVRVDELAAVVHVVPGEPERDKFYQRADFAIALLLGDGPSALAAALGGAPIDFIAAGDIDPVPYVASFEVAVERRGSLRDDLAPVAAYTVHVTDRRWLSHLYPGVTYACWARCEGGPRLPEDVLWEPVPPPPVGTFAPGDRVAVYADMLPSPGSRCGRGVVVETAVCARAPHGWEGGLVVSRVAFDHGPYAWVFAETLRYAPDDTYERAAADPARFFDDLLALAPVDRARGLRWMAVRPGGYAVIPAGEPSVGVARRSTSLFGLLRRLPFVRTVDVAMSASVAMRSIWLFGLLRRLPFVRAVDVGAALLAGWVRDPGGAEARFGAPVPGTELAAGCVAEPYLWQYSCPVELALGALTLLCAEKRAKSGAVRLPAQLRALVREILRDLPATWLGFPAHHWRGLLAYLSAATMGNPPALPAWVFDGYPPELDDAAHLGLSGAYVPPSSLDRFRP